MSKDKGHEQGQGPGFLSRDDHHVTSCQADAALQRTEPRETWRAFGWLPYLSRLGGARNKLSRWIAGFWVGKFLLFVYQSFR